ncbi:MAG: rhomboid family intramembrane serine protease [Planctomycetota bacterium]|nr:rhomboid family intramembrane serine protease [Planctomycetota bacterium]
MGVYDRPYWREEPPRPGGGYHRVSFNLPRLGRAIKTLLLINIAAFVVQTFMDNPSEAWPHGLISTFFGVTVGGWWQLWRYVSFQFLHGGMFHIFFNMLVLYFFGMPLERLWGPKRFTVFYLGCGVVAGLAYVVMGAIPSLHLPPGMPLIGASGGVYAVLLACAVLFPQIRVLVFFIIPMRIRTLAIIAFGLMVLQVLSSLSSGQIGSGFWSDVAHLGGAVAAVVWVLALPRLLGVRASMKARTNRGAWQRKMRIQAEQEAETDRILQKIHDHGIASLTEKEKEILQQASRRD